MDDKRIRELIKNMAGKEIFHLLAYRPRLLEKFREVILSEYTSGNIKSYDILAALEHHRAVGDRSNRRESRR